MYLALFGNTCQYFHGGGQHAGTDVAEVCRDSAFRISIQGSPARQLSFQIAVLVTDHQGVTARLGTHLGWLRYFL